MKIIQKELPITLENSFNGKGYRWVIDKFNVEIDSKRKIYDFLLGLPLVTDRLIESKTEIDTPFCGKTYISLYSPEDNNIPLKHKSGNFLEFSNIQSKVGFQIHTYAVSIGLASSYYYDNVTCMWAGLLLGGLYMFSPFPKKIEKKIIEKTENIVEKFSCDGKKNIDNILDEMNEILYGDNLLDGGIYEFIKKNVPFHDSIKDTYITAKFLKEPVGIIKEDCVSAEIDVKLTLHYSIDLKEFHPLDILSKVRIEKNGDEDFSIKRCFGMLGEPEEHNSQMGLLQ